MRYIVTADTDVGTVKRTNQDSIVIKHANTNDGKEVLMAIVCDGMGGLEKGEVASATVINEFSKWFNDDFPFELQNIDMKVIAGKWEWMLKELNLRIMNYGKENGVTLGTTFTGMLLIDDEYLIVHVGDTRVYYFSSLVEQITKDQTFVARAISRGEMTVEQAKTDKRRNVLLQCVGASNVVTPDIIFGKLNTGVYMICSDGFRHEITEKELYDTLNSANLINKEFMHANARYLIDLNKYRNERDNISVVLIKVEE